MIEAEAEAEASVAEGAEANTGSVLCLLTDPEGQPLRSALYLPNNAGPSQLLELVNTTLQNEEKLPYAFYISDQELVVQLGTYLQKNKVSVEKVLKIICQPQAIFRIRSVNRCSATIAGDFGDEDVGIVESISKLSIPKAAILGNHDAWFTSHLSQRGSKSNRVELQLQSLKEQHVGYSCMDFPLLGFSIVGGRPFSCGGERIFRREIIQERYGIHNMGESAERIFEAASGASEGNFVIILAHNGPKGLGANANDICGRDWLSKGGDYGDEDLREAIWSLKGSTGVAIPLVVFGHMHKELAFGAGLRRMIVVGDDSTIYLNAAIVPRVRSCEEESNAMQSRSSVSSKHNTLRAFTMIEIRDEVIERIAETWVQVSSGGPSHVAEETVLFERVHNHSQM